MLGLISNQQNLMKLQYLSTLQQSSARSLVLMSRRYLP